MLPCKTCVRGICLFSSGSPEYLTCRSGIYETGPSQSGANGCIPHGVVTARRNVQMIRMKKIARNVDRISFGVRQASVSLRKMNAMASHNAWIAQMNKGVNCPLGSFTVQNFVSIFLVCLIAQMNPTNRLPPAQTV